MSPPSDSSHTNVGYQLPASERNQPEQGVYPKIAADTSTSATHQRPTIRELIVFGGLFVVYVGSLLLIGVARVILAPLPERK